MKTYQLLTLYSNEILQSVDSLAFKREESRTVSKSQSGKPQFIFMCVFSFRRESTVARVLIMIPLTCMNNLTGYYELALHVSFWKMAILYAMKTCRCTDGFWSRVCFFLFPCLAHVLISSTANKWFVSQSDAGERRANVTMNNGPNDVAGTSGKHWAHGNLMKSRPSDDPLWWQLWYGTHKRDAAGTAF